MTAAFVSAGAAAGAFTLAVKPQIKLMQDNSEAAKKLADAQETAARKKALADELSAKGSSLAGKAEKAATTAKLAALDAQKAYDRQTKGMPKATADAALSLAKLKTAHESWSASLAKDTMPIFTKSLDIARKMLPQLTPLVKTAAAALGDLVDRVGRSVENGGFERFVKRLNDSAKTTFPAFLNSAKNISVGIAGIVNAFMPASGQMSRSIEDLTKKFADWGQGLKDSEGFQKFLDMAGQGSGILGNLGTAFGNVLISMGPLLGTTATLANGLASLINALPPETIQFLAVALLEVKLAVMGWNAAQMILNNTMRANVVGAIVTGVILLGAAFVTAWKKSQRFREIVTSVFAGLAVPILEFAKIALQGFKLVVGGILTFVSAVTGLGAKAFGWVPGIGKYFKKGAQAVENFRKDTNDAFDSAIDKVDGWKNKVENMPKVMRLKGDISDLNDKISEARTKLDDKNLSRERRAKLGADIREWNRKLHEARTELNDLDGKKATPKIGGNSSGLFDAVRRSVASLNGIKDRKPAINGDPSGLFGAVRRSIASLNTVKGRRPTISASNGGVLSAVRRAQSWINSIHGRSVTVTATVNAVVNASAKIRSWLGFAHGGMVRGYAAGGPIRGFPGGGQVRGPGTGTSDSILARLSNGEFVVRAAVVRRVGAGWLKALNDGTLPDRNLRPSRTGQVVSAPRTAPASVTLARRAAVQNVTIAIQGAIDPVSTAKQVRKVLLELKRTYGMNVNLGVG
ncbi:MAG: hypothetical protein HOY76_08290 [Streptomyces sp.]|nr:hypothetical protein [Streptomyces sp.]